MAASVSGDLHTSSISTSRCRPVSSTSVQYRSRSDRFVWANVAGGMAAISDYVQKTIGK